MTSKGSFFSRAIRDSREISLNAFVMDGGGIPEDALSVIDSEHAREVIQEARKTMERGGTLGNGSPLLRKVAFGRTHTAPELVKGEVAAVDGTYALPMQLYAGGQALCVGVGSLSWTRTLQQKANYWSSRVYVDEAKDTNDYIQRIERGLFSMSPSGFLRYWEIAHGLSIEEPIIFFDGTLVYEWLLGEPESIELYYQLFKSGKKCIGIMKSLKNSIEFANWARALKTGEIYIIETLAAHLDSSMAANKNHGEMYTRFASKDFLRDVAPHILRGVFKPNKKPFAFEVHEDHLEDMLRIMSADCQMNHPGHEIPYLLNRVDQEIQHTFKARFLYEGIAARMGMTSEELFFEEGDERDFR